MKKNIIIALLALKKQIREQLSKGNSGLAKDLK